jgi:hypothetical protein
MHLLSMVCLQMPVMVLTPQHCVPASACDGFDTKTSCSMPAITQHCASEWSEFLSKRPNTLCCWQLPLCHRPCCVLFAAAPFLQGAPVFETFWQGRLIPGACVDTLPFIEAIRSKRTAAQKDLLPDEIFGRLRWVGRPHTGTCKLYRRRSLLWCQAVHT